MSTSPTRWWVVAASTLGLTHAAVSLLWVLGGTWLLSTVGGSIEEWGRSGGPGVRLALFAVVLAKVSAVGVLWVAVARGGRRERGLAWLAGSVLTVYGGVLTVAGTLIANTSTVDDAADPYALRWHAYFWDPWFLLWGGCTLVALRLSAPGRPRDR